MAASLRVVALALLPLILSASAPVPPPSSTFDAVAEGRSCSPSTIDPQQTDCSFRVGKTLRFSIAGIGTRDAGITFTKSDIDGDYYAAFGLQHGCVIVWPGRHSSSAAVTDLAFVSPRNGKVYHTWEACARHE